MLHGEFISLGKISQSLEISESQNKVALSSASKHFHIPPNYAIPKVMPHAILQTNSASPHAKRINWTLNFELRKWHFGGAPLLSKQIDTDLAKLRMLE